MKKIIIMLLFIINTVVFSSAIHAATVKISGSINKIDYIKKDINIKGQNYKLSNTVKVYGFSGNKYNNVKLLDKDMNIKFSYSTNSGVKTISDIWVQPN